MGGSSEGSSFPSSKRRRQNDDDDCPRMMSCQRNKKHIYLVLDDWCGGYSIHRIDADDILDQDSRRGERKLPEPAALRLASPGDGGSPMTFAAVGTSIFAASNPRRRGDHAPPTLVYDTKTGAVTVGPRVPDRIHDLGGASMAVGETLYAVTSVPFEDMLPSSLLALSFLPTVIPDRQPFDPAMDWCWNTVPSPMPPPFDGIDIVAYAVHPDGNTIFISAETSTYALDTSNGTWKELGDWLLPFKGQAFFDSGLDAWVGLHRQYDGYVCCCPVTSLSTSTTQQPECMFLMEKLVRRNEEKPKHRPWLGGVKTTSLAYMGGSRFAFFENALCTDDFRGTSVIHITLFDLKYNHKGELKIKDHRATRSYAFSKNTHMFSHVAFWM